MTIEIDQIRLSYNRHFGDGLPVLLLHGWGANLMAMTPIFDFLMSQNRSVISLDLPGFGTSDAPPDHFGIFEYAETVKKFVALLGIDKMVVAGHSFGGRIAIILAANTDLADRIVLVDSAGMKPKRGLKYHLKVFRYKRAKKRGKNLEVYGSDDYKALGDSMKKVFCRVVNQHLEQELKKISCPALLIFGENDTDTPLYMAKRLKRGIKDSGLVVLKSAGHFSYLEQSARFNLILHEFIKGEQ